jgi:hypothetical protein
MEHSFTSVGSSRPENEAFIITVKRNYHAYLLFFFPKDEREMVQKKTFTKWVNSHLQRVSCRIVNLYTDLRDGRMLIKLLEVLSGERLVSRDSLMDIAFLITLQPGSYFLRMRM